MARPPLRQLLADERGMTLIELTMVLVILGVLLMVAVPSYLSLKDRTYKSAAQSNLKNVMPAVIQYGLDNSPNSRDDPDGVSTDNGYDNLSEGLLQLRYDPTLNTGALHAYGTHSGTSYCLYTWVDAWTAYQAGPGQQITVVPSASFVPGDACP